MLKLTVTVPAGKPTLVLQDSFPTEGLFVMVIAAGTTETKDISDGQLERVSPTLNSYFESGKCTFTLTPATGTPSWADEHASGMKIIGVDKNFIDVAHGMHSQPTGSLMILCRDALQGQTFGYADIGDATMSVNSTLRLTANSPGHWANEWSVEVTDDTGGGVALSIDTVNKIITIDLGGATPDAATLRTALNADETIRVLFTATILGTGASDPVVQGPTLFANGTGLGATVTVAGITAEIRAWYNYSWPAPAANDYILVNFSAPVTSLDDPDLYDYTMWNAGSAVQISLMSDGQEAFANVATRIGDVGMTAPRIEYVSKNPISRTSETGLVMKVINSLDGSGFASADIGDYSVPENNSLHIRALLPGNAGNYNTIEVVDSDAGGLAITYTHTSLDYVISIDLGGATVTPNDIVGAWALDAYLAANYVLTAGGTGAGTVVEQVATRFVGAPITAQLTSPWITIGSVNCTITGYTAAGVITFDLPPTSLTGTTVELAFGCQNGVATMPLQIMTGGAIYPAIARCEQDDISVAGATGVVIELEAGWDTGTGFAYADVGDYDGGDNNSLRIQSLLPGEYGLTFRVRVVDSGIGGAAVTHSTSIGVTYIDINLGGATPTAAAVKILIDADPHLLASVVVTAGGTGLGNVALQAYTSFTGAPTVGTPVICVAGTICTITAFTAGGIVTFDAPALTNSAAGEMVNIVYRDHIGVATLSLPAIA